MREISISTEVFALIWSLRISGEESESEILQRVLSSLSIGAPGPEELALDERPVQATGRMTAKQIRRAKWWEVIAEGLELLGGCAPLSRIYEIVEGLAVESGKHVPSKFDATVRGTLEDNCSDSGRYKRVRDIFWMPLGKGAGIWALRK